MKKQIFSLVSILLLINLFCIFCSCSKKNPKKINFEEYSTKLSTEKCYDIKLKLENSGYEKFKVYIKKDFSRLRIINFLDYNESLEGSPVKPEISFISDNDKNYISFVFNNDPGSYIYYKDDIGNEYFCNNSEDDVFYYIISGNYQKIDDGKSHYKVHNNDTTIKQWKNWPKEELKFLGISQNELWATMSYYLNKKIDKEKKPSD
ncbi:MAG: hypothetical protein ABF289_07275 [Clostridiales bacterium]